MACLLFVTSVSAQTDCHMHGTERWCVGPDGKESLYPATPTVSTQPTGTVTNCHSHEGVTVCTNEHGEEVEALPDLSNGTDEPQTTTVTTGNCHFHAGVEHCDEETTTEVQCVVSGRDYNKGLRIGTIFIILITSSIAAFGPIALVKYTTLTYTGMVFTIIKQFGTGVIVATAFIHLLTHAAILFGNPCIGQIFEATTSAIAMAGLFSAFLVEYIGDRFVQMRANKNKTATSAGDAPTVVGKEDTGSNGSEQDIQGPVAIPFHSHGHTAIVNDKLAVMVMEAGIVFHSILIGIALIVSGDSVFVTLLIVVVFHQMFEGLALGTRIALLPDACASMMTKLLLALVFATITPIGMAIGIGVLNKFNGNDKHTLIAMATLDAFSAGILVWVGVVEMWAADWLNGDLRSARPLKTIVALISLMGGMALMGLLGKWA